MELFTAGIDFSRIVKSTATFWDLSIHAKPFPHQIFRTYNNTLVCVIQMDDCHIQISN